MTQITCTGAGKSSPLSYLLRDDYLTDIAAGSINGTLSDPGGMGGATLNTRTVVDTGLNLSLSSDWAVFAAGLGAPSYNDPILKYGSTARTLGKVFGAKIYINSATGVQFLGIGSGAQPPRSHGWNLTGSLVYIYDNNVGSNTGLPYFATGTEFQIAIVVRATGAWYFIKGGALTGWTLIHYSIANADTPLVYSFQNRADSYKFTHAIIPLDTYIPKPIFSDSFNRADGAAGNGDGAGDSEVSCNPVAWADKSGALAISSNRAIFGAVSGIGISVGEAGAYDVIATVNIYRSAGNPGLCLRYLDADNYIYAYHDGTNVKLVERLNGIETTTVTAVKAYADGAPLKVVIRAGLATLWYNNSYAGRSTDVGGGNPNLLYGTKHGLYATETASTFDSFIIMPSGTEGQHAALNRFFSSPAHYILTVGDSKVGNYPQYLTKDGVDIITFPNVKGGTKITTLEATYFPGWLTNTPGAPDTIFFNLTVNSTGADTKAQYKASALAMIEAYHAKWPTVKIYIARMWRRYAPASYALLQELNEALDEIIVLHPDYCLPGPDERIWLENGDDGITYTDDGIHPNAAGTILQADQWLACIGF